MGIHDRDYMRKDTDTGQPEPPWPLLAIVLICFAAATVSFFISNRAARNPIPIAIIHDLEPDTFEVENLPDKPADPIEIKLLNVNLATYEQLLQIPYINRKIALSLIQQRPFSKWDDLISVYGIGPKRLESLKLYLYIPEASSRKKDSEDPPR